MSWMKELCELCRSGKDVRLSDDATAEEVAAVTAILQKHYYVKDPQDPLLFVSSGNHSFHPRDEIGTSFRRMWRNIRSRISSSSPSSSSSSSSSSAAGPSRTTFPDAVPQIEYTPPDSGLDLETAWLSCTCVQIDTRRLPDKDQVRILTTIPHQEFRDQRVGIKLVIEPKMRMSRANVDVELCTRVLFVGVHSQDIFKDSAIMGYYPYQMKLSLEPQLEDPNTVAIPLYTSRSEGRSGNILSDTRTSSTNTKINAQIGFWPVSISGEQSWGMQIEESKELVAVSAGDEEAQGNTAVFEWTLLRWSHSGVKYNSARPHSGLGFFTKSLKTPFPRGNTGANVDNFPDVLWHLPSTQKSPIKFNFQLEVDMHLVWFAGENKIFRAANWTSQGFQFLQQFQVSPGS